METKMMKKRPYLKKTILSTPSSETWEIYSDEFIGDNDSPIAPTSLENLSNRIDKLAESS